VFTDIDLPNTTSLEFFGAGNSSLGTFFVSPFDNGLSFLGVSFTEGPIIERVRITIGNNRLGPAEGSGVDVGALDDFIYAEPIPEPNTTFLTVAGLVALLWFRKRRLPHLWETGSLRKV
jgi:hypothetical protein